MPRPNVLRRCTVCRKYGAPFLRTTPSGKAYYCYECWKKFVAQPSSGPDRNVPAKTGPQPPTERRDG
jgi:hypothetical protein